MFAQIPLSTVVRSAKPADMVAALLLCHGRRPLLHALVATLADKTQGEHVSSTACSLDLADELALEARARWRSAGGREDSLGERRYIAEAVRRAHALAMDLANAVRAYDPPTPDELALAQEEPANPSVPDPGE